MAFLGGDHVPSTPQLHLTANWSWFLLVFNTHDCSQFVVEVASFDVVSGGVVEEDRPGWPAQCHAAVPSRSTSVLMFRAMPQIVNTTSEALGEGWPQRCRRHYNVSWLSFILCTLTFESRAL